NEGRVVANFILQALKGEPITIYGDGSQTRSFCFVSDLICALIKMMNTDKVVTGPINLGNPHEIPVKELAERIIKMTGSKSKIEFRKLPEDDPTQRCPDITKAKNILDWEPKIELEEGLEQTIKYFKERLQIKDI
ncbi:MAG: GDP-mannose 4,6-dehydratase, partial [Patescibacteria group bacterium]